MTRLITLVIGCFALAFSAAATPNRITSSANTTSLSEYVTKGENAVFSFAEAKEDSPSSSALIAEFLSENDLMDVTFSASDATADVGDQVCLDFSVSGFTDVVSFQYSMNWDASLLAYSAVQNENLTDLNVSAFGSGGTANGNLTVSWFHQATTGVTVPDGTVIYQVCFDVLAAAEGQSTDVSFSGSPTSIEVTDNTAAVLNFMSTPGTVTVNGDSGGNGGGNGGGGSSSDIIFSATSATGDVGDQVCLDISVQNFTDIVSFQYSMNWDETILNYSSVENINLTDLNASAFGSGGTANGNLTVSWFHQATTGVTVPDGTVIYQVCFDIATGTEGQSSDFTFSGSPTSVEVTDNTSAVIPFVGNDGQVTVNGDSGGNGGGGSSSDIIFSATSATGDVGDQVCLDISVQNFTDIVSFQYSMNWDETVLNYSSVENINLTDLNGAAFGTGSTGTGDLTVSWFHQATTGVTVPDGTVIYQVCFDIATGAEGQSSDFTFSSSPTSVEVTDNTSAVVPFVGNDGQVTVTGDSGGNGGGNGGGGSSSDIIFSATSATGDVGDQVCLDISVENFTDIVSFQYSMNWDETVLNYSSVENINLTDLNASAFGTGSTGSGDLTVSWFHQATTGVTVPDGTVIYQVCFDIATGSEGQSSDFTFSGSPTSVEVTDNTSAVVPFVGNAGMVTVNGDNGGGGGNGGGNSDSVTFSVDSADAAPGDEVCLNVSVTDFANVVSFQYSMMWDADVLDFTSVDNINLTDLNTSAFGTAGTGNGSLTVSWFHQATTGVTVPDGTNIYQVCFTVIGTENESSLVSFTGSPTSIEVTDNTNSVLDFVSDIGQVNVTGGGNGGGGGTNNPLAFIVEQTNADAGSQTCLSVSVEGFTDIVSFQYSLNWDETELSFNEVQNINLTDLNTSAFGTGSTDNGILTVSWFHQATTGVTVPDGTVIYEVCFDAIGSAGTNSGVAITGNPTSLEVTDNTNSVLNPVLTNGGVNIQGGNGGGGGTQNNDNLTFTIESGTFNAGDNICLDVTADDFIDVVSAQFSITWDSDVLSFTGVQGFNLPDLNEASFGGNTANGVLTLSWFEQLTQGATVPNGTSIFQICFEVTGNPGEAASVAFGGSPTSIEVTEAGSGQVLNPTFNNGTVSVDGEVSTDELVFQYQCVDAQPGDMICIPVAVQNFEDIVSFQYSMHWNDDILSYQNVQGFNLSDLNNNSFGAGNAANGTLSVSWFDEQTVGVSVPGSSNGPVTLFEICFEVIGNIGQNTLMTFDGNPTAIEATGPGAQVLPITFIQCVVNVVNDCAAVNIQQNSITNPACQGASTGAIDVSVSGGDNNYTYQWTNTATGAVVGNNQDITGLSAGNYTLNVSSCNGNETTSQTFQVTEPQAISVIEVIENVSCVGDQNGSISVTGQGGTGNLTYAWSGGSLPSGTSSPNISGLVSATYSLTVTDANSCTFTETFEVAAPASQLSLAATPSSVSCNGGNDGEILISPTGGWGGYSYAWAQSGLSGENPTGLSPGTYTVSVTDANGCEVALSNIPVEEPEVITVTGTTTDVNGDQPGSIDITAAGGNIGAPYSFAWSGPDSFTAATEDIGDLTIGGEYCVTVTDANNCNVTECFSINSPLLAVVAEVQPSCAGESNGSINLETFGGQGNYTYTWTYNNTPTTENTEDLSNIQGGTWTVLVTDQNAGSFTETIVVGEAAEPLAVTTVIEQLSDEFTCDGSINASMVTGGFGGYTYQWNTPDNDVTSSVSGLCAGTYTVTITDNEGCEIIETTTILFVEEALVATSFASDASCAGECSGTVTVNIQSGVEPIAIEVKDMNGNLLASALDSDGVEVLSGLCAQDVVVEITDNAGQESSLNLTIAEPDPLVITGSTVFPVTTANGSNSGAISLQVEGGTGNYDYSWTNGSGGQDNINLPMGNYSVTIEDENDCQITSEVFAVQLFEVNDETVTDVDCIGNETGTACVGVTGGNGAYSYAWSNGGTASCIDNTTAGSYTVTITDTASGVSIEETVQIGTQSNLTSTASTTSLFMGGANISCAGRTDGSAAVTAQGGAGNVSFLWSNNSTESTITQVPAGVYTVTATDAIGCESISTIELTEPQPFEVTLETAGISCTDQRDGEITAVSTGGANTNTADYDYEWTGSGLINPFLPTINNLAPGLFSVIVTDPNGCEATANIELVNPAPLTLEAETTPDDGSGTGTATAIVSGGTSDYSYNWQSNGDVGTTREITGLSAGAYMLIVTDANGCTEMLTDIIVGDNSLGCLDTRIIISPDGDGMNDEFIINCIENFADNYLEIFNRYGQLVYRQEDYNCGTDDCAEGWRGTNLRGTDLPGGGYFYVLEYTDVDGTAKQLKGSITIMRE